MEWNLRFHCMCYVCNVSILYHFVLLLGQKERKRRGRKGGKKGSVRNTSPLSVPLVLMLYPLITQGEDLVLSCIHGQMFFSQDRDTFFPKHAIAAYGLHLSVMVPFSSAHVVPVGIYILKYST